MNMELGKEQNNLACYTLLVDLLWEVRKLIDSPNTDITWSNYRSVEEVLSACDTYIERLNENDKSVVTELELLFAPTGSLQEISISSGWSNEYIGLSSRFDDIVGCN
ncbi:hypothetical protein BC351_12275 [Paenibacillus ferrarius]|uniref:Uncharacterized protein n=1 Tax=Paenibacillus ferrarius TaxID=1469647 RepID=A0A1V4H831_9BACL|nr:hypothetical protein [Paenibacillus ferrarius]OPH47269.1 hypothetical protein BC351_12275 [Paenibacillus ferrarius]